MGAVVRERVMLNKGLSTVLFVGLVSAAVSVAPAMGEPGSHDPPWPPTPFKESAADTFAYVDNYTDGNLLGLNITDKTFLSW